MEIYVMLQTFYRTLFALFDDLNIFFLLFAILHFGIYFMTMQITDKIPNFLLGLKKSLYFNDFRSLQKHFLFEVTFI